jgi:serine/threonine protein kinase
VFVIWCLNPDCLSPQNQDGIERCLSCDRKLVPLLRGHYRIIAFLGGGGFGRTYLAEDVHKFDEQCVVKQLAPQFQGSKALQKATELFEQEAKRLQELGKYPQIPTLFAYFQEGKYLFLVQEFIDWTLDKKYLFA